MVGVVGFGARAANVSRETGTPVRGRWRLFPDAETGEDLIEDVFDIDAAGDAAELKGGAAEVLGAQFRVLK